MTSQHDHDYELGSSDGTVDGPERAEGDASPSVDMSPAKWQRTDEPGDVPPTESEYTAGSAEPADQEGLAGSGAIRGEIIEAEGIAESPGQPVSNWADGLAAAGSAQDATAAAGADGRSGDTDLSQEWRDIQAAFVDDPAGAVQLAADATNAALTALIDRLRTGQSGLTNGTSSLGEPDTEQLRVALREYRTLCENVDQIGRRLLELM